jgi:hypothetical protein
MMAQSEQKMDYKLTISSDSFTQSDASGLVSLVVEEHVDMIGMLVCRFSASESLSYQIGDEVKLSVGDEEVFTGFITALEPSMSVGSGAFATLRAMDPLYKLTRGRKTKQYDEMTDSDAAKQVLGDAGLSASADSTSPTHEYILQRNESDMAFLKRLAARNNFMLRMVDGKASFIKAQYSGNGTEFEFNASDSGDQAPLVSVNMAYTSTDQVQKVTVRGWDYNKKEEIVGTSTASDVDKIGDGKLGLDVCSTFGDATAYVTDVPVSDQSSAYAAAHNFKVPVLGFERAQWSPLKGCPRPVMADFSWSPPGALGARAVWVSIFVSAATPLGRKHEQRQRILRQRLVLSLPI